MSKCSIKFSTRSIYFKSVINYMWFETGVVGKKAPFHPLCVSIFLGFVWLHSWCIARTHQHGKKLSFPCNMLVVVVIVWLILFLLILLLVCCLCSFGVFWKMIWFPFSNWLSILFFKIVVAYVGGVLANLCWFESLNNESLF